jgi:DNA-3-methyladenine glycosylase I
MSAKASAGTCAWAGNDPQMVTYHDQEWGTPVHDDRKLFEYMVLDSFQAGLSWQIILHKRAGFDRAFGHFEPAVVAEYDLQDVERLMQDAGIVRNRLKIAATITNAKAALEIQREFGSLDGYLWRFAGGRTIQHRHEMDSQIGTTSEEAEAMSQDLRKRGFKFFGPTVCYAFMQGAGMVNDHLVSCFRYSELSK